MYRVNYHFLSLSQVTLSIISRVLQRSILVYLVLQHIDILSQRIPIMRLNVNKD